MVSRMVLYGIWWPHGQCLISPTSSYTNNKLKDSLKNLTRWSEVERCEDGVGEREWTEDEVKKSGVEVESGQKMELKKSRVEVGWVGGRGWTGGGVKKTGVVVGWVEESGVEQQEVEWSGDLSLRTLLFTQDLEETLWSEKVVMVTVIAMKGFVYATPDSDNYDRLLRSPSTPAGITHNNNLITNHKFTHSPNQHNSYYNITHVPNHNNIPHSPNQHKDQQPHLQSSPQPSDIL
ncbi:hypothetical protein Pmani_002871 [Petrolisthes manimaculis]|uniref:Uncharacterized protein n=1 Tax=Petrolisthes manimaculis TaxID=1843537 RepID=A0AAE1QGQ2_9EUCA|nr:hypothetical protein Pmani_002871 [Petrolisthes manimaculis]